MQKENMSEMMIRSLKRYWNDVDAETNNTQVAEVATATAGSTPVTSRKGEKMRPPPIPTSPARIPATNDTAT